MICNLYTVILWVNKAKYKLYGKINFAAQFKDDMALEGSFQFQVDLEFFQGKWEGGKRVRALLKT